MKRRRASGEEDVPGQHFDGYFAHQFEISGAIDNAHSATTDFALEPVTVAQYSSWCNAADPSLAVTQNASVLRVVTHWQQDSRTRAEC